MISFKRYKQEKLEVRKNMSLSTTKSSEFSFGDSRDGFTNLYLKPKLERRKQLLEKQFDQVQQYQEKDAAVSSSKNNKNTNNNHNSLLETNNLHQQETALRTQQSRRYSSSTTTAMSNINLNRIASMHENDEVQLSKEILAESEKLLSNQEKEEEEMPKSFAEKMAKAEKQMKAALGAHRETNEAIGDLEKVRQLQKQLEELKKLAAEAENETEEAFASAEGRS